ncbi:MAG: glycosyltransferase [Egibacteraceae bacterium]
MVLGGLWLARRWHVPHLSHVHEIFWQHRAVVGGVERLLVRSDAIICASKAVREQFRSPACRRRCRVAHSGVEVPDVLVATTPLMRAVPRVVCVGRLSDLKGQDLLIDAVHRCAANGQPMDLHLVGDVYAAEDQHKRRLQAQVRRLGLQDVVHFEGERRDVLRFVADSDVLVLPSRRPEAFGMALVEAMALARPVIASAAGGPLEIVTHGRDGLLVAPGSIRELADALRQLVDEPERARAMGEQARRRARSFTVAAMVDAVLAVYDEVADGRGRGGREGGGVRCV